MKTSRLLLVGLFLSNLVVASPTWWRDKVFYEIFVRSFQDSNGDGIGDLPGITRRLDYLKALGIGGLWLTPVFPSPSYHGYDATDYESINPEFGTLSDMQDLIDAAHARGIAIVLDFAINHTSEKHRWFDAPEQHDWYVRRDSIPDWGKWFPDRNEFYFSVFGSAMPQLNWRNTDVRTAVRKAAEFWLARGIDGFRLDAARYYAVGPHGESDTPETHRAIAEFASTLRSEYPERLIVGEIWADSPTIASYGGDGEQLDLAFSFPIAGALVEAARTRAAGGLISALRENTRDIVDSGFDAPFLTNHDQTRVASMLNGDRRALGFAAEVLMALPGTPFVYYGEELGMPNGASPDDRDKRQPMRWDENAGVGFTTGTPWYAVGPSCASVAVQERDPDSLLNRYRGAIARRNADVVLRRGALLRADTADGGRLAVWQRAYGGRGVIVAANFSDGNSAPQTIAIDARAARCAPARLNIPSLAPLTVGIYPVIGSCQSAQIRR